MRRQHSWFALAAFGTITLSLGAAVAADVDKERETLMKGFGEHMKVIKGALTENKGTIADAAKAAHEIAANSHKIPSVFPPGSVSLETNAESEALPVIWQRWPEFENKAKNMGELANALAAAADSGNPQATLAAFGDLGKNGCSGCHETFRKKKS